MTPPSEPHNDSDWTTYLRSLLVWAAVAACAGITWGLYRLLVAFGGP